MGLKLMARLELPRTIPRCGSRGVPPTRFEGVDRGLYKPNRNST